MTVTIYHNPRCSKSRATLKLIEENGVAPVIVPYLDQPPSAKELAGILQELGLRPREVMRKGEAIYKELELGDESLSDEALILAMASNPILIERPIVVTDKGARIGRPPENVLDIL